MRLPRIGTEILFVPVLPRPEVDVHPPDMPYDYDFEVGERIVMVLYDGDRKGAGGMRIEIRTAVDA